jgi:hypothetical protein
MTSTTGSFSRLARLLVTLTLAFAAPGERPAFQEAQALALCGPVPADCHTYTCDASGQWVLKGNKANGTTCNDFNSCTTGDKCTSGSCSGTWA